MERRRTLGSEGEDTMEKWKLIADFVTDADMQKISADLNGCSEIIVYAYANYDSEKSGEYLYFLVNGKSVIVGQNMRFGNAIRNYYMHCILLPNGLLAVNLGYGLQNFSMVAASGMAPFKHTSPDSTYVYGESLEKIELSNVDPSKKICANSRFIVYGR